METHVLLTVETAVTTVELLIPTETATETRTSALVLNGATSPLEANVKTELPMDKLALPLSPANGLHVALTWVMDMFATHTLANNQAKTAKMILIVQRTLSVD
jgi:hypothetical protein